MTGRIIALASALLLCLPGAGPADASGAAPTESWSQVANQSFLALDALERSQGVATDGTSWIFSWQSGFVRTTLDGTTVLARNAMAIPQELQALGDNHIGDIDYVDGIIYASIEDGKAYQHPYVALYDAVTLEYTGVAYPLPLAVSAGGVPWVAADLDRGFVYTAQWDPTLVLNVFSLADMSLVKTVPLSQKLGRIQGAKIYGGVLYASVDDSTQSIYRINPDTGAVDKVIDRNLPKGTEAEGLAVLETDDGAILHTLDVAPIRVMVNFRSFGRAG